MDTAKFVGMTGWVVCCRETLGLAGYREDPTEARRGVCVGIDPALGELVFDVGAGEIFACVEAGDAGRYLYPDTRGGESDARHVAGVEGRELALWYAQEDYEAARFVRRLTSRKDQIFVGMVSALDEKAARQALRVFDRGVKIAKGQTIADLQVAIVHARKAAWAIAGTSARLTGLFERAGMERDRLVALWGEDLGRPTVAVPEIPARVAVQEAVAA